jgi:hypothetical protein
VNISGNSPKATDMPKQHQRYNLLISMDFSRQALTFRAR